MDMVLSKQEEIYNGIRDRLIKPLEYVDLEETYIPEDTIPYLIMQYLKDMGCVLKVEKELPEPKYPNSTIDCYIWEAQKEMLEAGYTAYEEL